MPNERLDASDVSMVSRIPAHFIVIGFITLSASCNSEGKPTENESSPATSPVIQITEDVATLPYDAVNISMDIVSRDRRGLPMKIEIAFQNKSSERGCLALPRPVVEDRDYNASLPCLCVGMRGLPEFDGSTPPEPFFLYVIPRREFAGPLEGVYLDPDEKVLRQYNLTSFCVIGHGIGPKPNANFSTCYHAGTNESELRAYVITDWNKFSRVESNPVVVQSSEADFSVRDKLGE